MKDNQAHPPLVAIVTPVYNGEPWLEKTLACVQAQTYPNLIHIVLDNASTDATPATIARFQGGRVPIVTRRNDNLLPQTQNWNAAFALVPAEAKYAKLLCADDLIRADAIAKLTALAETDPEIDYVGAIDIYNDRAEAHRLDPAQPIISGKDYGRRYLLRDVHWPAANHAFFRAHPEFVHHPFDERVTTHCDSDMLLRRLLTRKIGFVFEPLYYTRTSNTTVTTMTKGNRGSAAYDYRQVSRYGAAHLEPQELSRTLSRERLRLARRLLRWIVMGDVRSSGLAYQVLHEADDAITLWDMLKGHAVWPFYLAEMASRKRYAPAETGAMSEGEFLAQAQPAPCATVQVANDAAPPLGRRAG